MAIIRFNGWVNKGFRVRHLLVTKEVSSLADIVTTQLIFSQIVQRISCPLGSKRTGRRQRIATKLVVEVCRRETWYLQSPESENTAASNSWRLDIEKRICHSCVVGITLIHLYHRYASRDNEALAQCTMALLNLRKTEVRK